MHRPLNPPSIRAPFARYSHGVEVAEGKRMVVLSGQLGARADDTVPESVEDQAEICFANIAAILGEAGMTLADVALRLGVSKPTVWAWEKGKARPLPERMAAIAEALGAAPEDLTEAGSHNADTAALIAECRGRIAEACGTTPAAVRIMIEL